MGKNPKRNPGHQKPDPLEALEPQPPSHEARAKQGRNPIKDRHIEYLWFAQGLKRCTGLHDSFLVLALNLVRSECNILNTRMKLIELRLELVSVWSSVEKHVHSSRLKLP